MPLPPAQLDDFCAFALRLADAAGTIALRYFRQPLAVDSKADDSPVTIADREIESAIRSLISNTYPDHGILGEEHGRIGLDREFLWVIDPIDGTKSFITGMPTFGVLIALVWRGVPVVGVVDHPAMGERFVGVSGRPTLWNGRACKVAACSDIAKASLFATTYEMFTGAEAEAFARLAPRARLRRQGADCFAYALLSGGHIDSVVEAQLQPYDYMALVPMIEGAGGLITDWAGKPLTIQSDGRVVAAATPALHRQILDILG